MLQPYRGIVAALVLLPLAAWAGEANLDPTFGSFGLAVTNVNAGDDSAAAVVRQTDGKLVAAGSSEQGGTFGFTIVRYDANGAIDSSYGTGGVAHVAFGANTIAQNAVLQPDGKLVVAGVVFGKLGAPDDEIAIARLDATGALDPSFGSGGKVVTDLTPSYDSADALALQADGELLVGSSSHDGSGQPHLNVVRYLTDGSLDTTFGTGGHVTTAIGGSDIVGDMVVQSDGKIVVVGTSDSDAVLVRYDATGALDPLFGAGGIVQTSFSPTLAFPSAVLQPDGKVVLAGSSDTHDFAIARFTDTGAVDAGFGTGGITYTDFGGIFDLPTALVRRADGRLVAVGEIVRATDPDPDIDIGFASYTPNGSPDGAFAPGGKLTFSVGPGVDEMLGMVLQPDGKLVAAGETSDDGGADTRFLVLRLGSTCGDGNLDPGEECDDGNASSNDCCSIACRYDAAGSSCDLDADACTADVCDGAGTCTAGGPLVCGVCQQCDVALGCVAAPPATTCKTPTTPGASKLKIKRNPQTGRALVGWKWTKGQATTFAELGDPTAATDYGFCLYGTSLGPQYVSIDAPAGDTCGTRPCWSSIPAKGFRYKDALLTPNGVLKMKLLSGGAGKAQATMAARNVLLNFPTYFGLGTMGPPLRAQLRSRGGLCLEAQYSSFPNAGANALSTRSD